MTSLILERKDQANGTAVIGPISLTRYTPLPDEPDPLVGIGRGLVLSLALWLVIISACVRICNA